MSYSSTVGSAYSLVMRGLDPRIHPPLRRHFFEGWIAGSSQVKPGDDE